GWQPPTLTQRLEGREVHSGRIVTQFHFKDVYSKRPLSISLRPDGRRALVALGQTGNFGVLDRTFQQVFTDVSLRVPNDFSGLVAVTKPIDFYPDLVARRG